VLPKLRISYPDIAAWQRARSEQEAAIAEQISFWRRQMAGAPQLIGLQTDYPRLAERSRTAGQVHISMPEALVSRLHARAAALRTTFFSVLLAGYALVLSRMSGEEDVVIGSAVAGRMHTEAESLIGCFATGLPLRLTVAADLTGTSWSVTRARSY
jgi:syringomycin synthetase protein SyrE